MLDRLPASDLSAAKIEIPEIRYKADLELHDRYLGFSSELLRLALAGMTAIGAIIALFAHDGTLPASVKSGLFFGTALSALALLATAAALALSHRFLASDGFYHHLRAIKLLILRENLLDPLDDEKASSLVEKARREETARNNKFKWAGRFLMASGIFITAGVVLLGCSFASVLMAK